MAIFAFFHEDNLETLFGDAKVFLQLCRAYGVEERV